jgi:hypothetical protein
MKTIRIGDTEFDVAPDDRYPWAVFMRGDDGLYRTHGHAFQSESAAREFIRAEVGVPWRLVYIPDGDCVDEST